MKPTMTIDTAAFNRQIAAIKRASGRAGSSTVQYWSRIMLKKLAWKTAKATCKFKMRGRLRAGWWPAASALGSPTVYSGSFGNQGEGSYIDKRTDPVNPSFTMTNTVPYGPHVKGIMGMLQQGVNEVEARARAEWERKYASELKGFAGI
jgi:hypothetical protein